MRPDRPDATGGLGRDGEHDADELVARMRADTQADWPARLMAKLAALPVVPEELIGRHRQRDGVPITPPEAECLQAAAVGLTVQMTADTYGRSAHTIVAQLQSARRKLGAKNTTHAVALALRQGLIR